MSEKFPQALPEGTILAGQYIIESVLGQGGFGITYRARDHKNGNPVAIKEFFPESLAARIGGTTVRAFSDEKGSDFLYGKDCFLQEAETLSKFIGNQNIIRVYTYFEENGTAYFVMEYVEGTGFDKYIRSQGGKISYEDSLRILIPVMDALSEVHRQGIVHRDVSPDNIIITNDGTVKLLDFGAARYSLGEKSRSLDVVLKHGYAPKEQYARHGRQGPYTDVYALGATFYFALTGKTPVDSIERIDEDELIPLSTLGVRISEHAENVILKALNLRAEDRYQSMSDFKNALLGKEPETVSIPVQSSKTERIDPSAMSEKVASASAGREMPPVYNDTSTQGKQPSKKKKGLFIGLGIAGVLIAIPVVLVLIIVIFVLIIGSASGKKTNNNSNSSYTTSTTATESSSDKSTETTPDTSDVSESVPGSDDDIETTKSSDSEFDSMYSAAASEGMIGIDSVYVMEGDTVNIRFSKDGYDFLENAPGLQYKSLDESVASVEKSSDGNAYVIKGISSGNTNIQAVYDGYSAMLTIYVFPKIDTVTLDDVSQKGYGGDYDGNEISTVFLDSFGEAKFWMEIMDYYAYGYKDENDGDSYDEFKSEYTGNIYFYTTDTLRIEVSGGFGAWNGDNDSLQLTFSDAGGYGKGFATMVVMNRDNTEAVLVLKIPVKME